MAESNSKNILRRPGLTWALLALLLFARLIAMAVTPYFDTTEARYGEFGRKMVEINDWITPWFNYGVPYWGKPPFSFWLTALGFKLFGVNEFAGRLPHLLMSLVVLGIVGWLAGRRDKNAVLPAITLISGMFLYYLLAGAVMVDVEFTLGLTMVMAGFWLAVEDREPPAGGVNWRAAGWVFGGLLLGLLNRGPIGVLFPGIALVLWTAWQRRWHDARVRLPWLSGSLATLALALPWYIIAEQHTPGFLRYFIVGEHFYRYTIPGWTGDRYGFAHKTPIGMIWIYACLGTLPWSVIVPISFWRWRKRPPSATDAGTAAVDMADTGKGNDGNAKARPDERAWQGYLLLWAAVPLVFFTLARNVNIPYVMPALPAAALLTAGLVVQQFRSERDVTRMLNIGLVFNLLLCVALLRVVLFPSALAYRSDKYLVQAYQNAAAAKAPDASPEPLIYVAPRASFSGDFYSRGRALKANSPEQALALAGTRTAYLATTRPESVMAWFDDYNKAHNGPSGPNQARRTVTLVGRYGGRSLLFLAESPE